MKNFFLLGALLSFSYIGFSQIKSEKIVEDDSLMCKIYRVIIGSDEGGCGGGKRICCANTKLNHI